MKILFPSLFPARACGTASPLASSRSSCSMIYHNYGGNLRACLFISRCHLVSSHESLINDGRSPANFSPVPSFFIQRADGILNEKISGFLEFDARRLHSLVSFTARSEESFLRSGKRTESIVLMYSTGEKLNTGSVLNRSAGLCAVIVERYSVDSWDRFAKRQSSGEIRYRNL